jgi:single-stranded-DNA-specific exonuclease
MQPLETIYSKLQGVTRTNLDGSQRQEVIAELCYNGQPLLLLREPNQYSYNNIGVYVAYQVGQVSPEIAEALAPLIDQGRVVQAQITEITGGTTDKPTRGVNVSFTIFE